MKFLRLVLPIALLLITTAAFADSDAQKSFDQMKTLAGNWEGPVTVVPPQPDMSSDKPIHVLLRTTSRGNALVHEMQEAGTPEDPTRYDHPVTMFYLDGDRLLLTHYCDAGNRPRMVAKRGSSRHSGRSTARSRSGQCRSPCRPSSQNQRPSRSR